ncbi:MAG: hypothetical protein IJ087_19825, partial [Eggerthellaceae bacterium]|nr:hypothetical protein [Eggerthellaceae bacterium]
MRPGAVWRKRRSACRRAGAAAEYSDAAARLSKDPRLAAQRKKATPLRGYFRIRRLRGGGKLKSLPYGGLCR